MRSLRNLGCITIVGGLTGCVALDSGIVNRLSSHGNKVTLTGRIAQVPIPGVIERYLPPHNSEVLQGRRLTYSEPHISTEWYFDQNNKPEEAILNLDFDRDGQTDVRGVIDLTNNSQLISQAQNLKPKSYDFFPDPSAMSLTEAVFRLPQSNGHITFYASETFRNSRINPQSLVYRALPNITPEISFLPLE